jgi:acyl carrier protein
MVDQNDVELKVRGIMADLFVVDVERIDESTSMSNTETWDSANHISLVLALEEEFGISFDVAEIESIVSFADVVQAVLARSG